MKVDRCADNTDVGNQQHEQRQLPSALTSAPAAVRTGPVVGEIELELQRLTGESRDGDVIGTLRSIAEARGDYYLTTVFRTAVLSASGLGHIPSWEFADSATATRFRHYADLYIVALRAATGQAA